MKLKIALGVISLFTLQIACPLYSNAAENFLNKENWLVRARVINVNPDENSTTSIGGKVTADNAFVPELDITYFWTKNIGTELILGVTPHNMGAVGTSIGNVDLGDVWLLPPTLTMQYHFNPEGKIRPYAGAGINYTVFFDANPGGVSKIEYENGFGYALQGGVDYALNEHWMLNADVKKLYLQTDVKINNGAITADVDLDPWIFGLGIGYKF